VILLLQKIVQFKSYPVQKNFLVSNYKTFDAIILMMICTSTVISRLVTVRL